MPGATELLLLGGFGVPSSDKMVTSYCFAANCQVPEGVFTLVPSKSPLESLMVLMLHKLQEVGCIFLVFPYMVVPSETHLPMSL